MANVSIYLITYKFTFKRTKTHFNYKLSKQNVNYRQQWHFGIKSDFCKIIGIIHQMENVDLFPLVLKHA